MLPWNHRLRRKWRAPVGWMTYGAILAVATLDTLSLVCLRRMPESHVSLTATAQLASQGAQFVRYIAGSEAAKNGEAGAEDTRRLDQLVSALYAAQPGLQYVEISRDGRSVFRRQIPASPDDGAAGGATAGSGAPFFEPPPAIPGEVGEERIPVSMTRTVLPTASGQEIPVLVFHREFPLDDGGTARVELALKRNLPRRDPTPENEGVTWMFYIALGTTCVAFAACLVICAWAIRRDSRREAQRRREEHLAVSGALANGIVHDFRNPMSSVRLDAQMLEREARREGGPRPERVGELSGRIGRTVARMDDIFKEFLYLAKPDPAGLETVDLRQFAAECVETLAARYEAAGVACAIPPGDAPVPAVAMASALRRALVNVFLNAAQFSPEGSTVDVAFGGDDARREAWIEVRDRGPGIPPRDREHIFDMFSTTRPGGTGLGLFLAKAAVEHSRGRIGVWSRDGGGTVFRITLPAPSPEDGLSQDPPAP